MPLSSLVLLFFAAAIGGGLNSVAGGGSFIAFPALLFTGVPPVAANATNSVALWPAGIASAIAYRKEMRQSRKQMLTLGLTAFVGGVTGAVLLLKTRDTTFVKLIPFLLLLATVLFTFGTRITAAVRARMKSRTQESAESAQEHGLGIGWGMALQLVIALYGGYFGGGMGIMMLAVYSLMGMTDIHAMNGLKTLVSTVINGVAIAAFIYAGAVAWGPGSVMIVGGTAGGYAGAAIARKMSPVWIRRFVLVVAWGMTAFFFVKTYVLKS